MVDKAIVEDFIEAIKTEQPDKNRTYSAVVSRIDQEGVVWVSLVGSDRETPTASTSSEVKRGDDVMVEWRNNKLYIVGNSSNPAAGTFRVTAVEQATAVAREAAASAVNDAATARGAADSAQGEAAKAKTEAESATQSAADASTSAETAMVKLGIIENVAGAVNWIAEHGTYKTTQDTAITPGQYYFVQSGQSYSIAEAKDVSPVTEGWYEYDSVQEAYSLSADTSMVTGKQYYANVPDTDIYNEVGFNDANPRANGWKELDYVDQSVANYISSYLVLIGDVLRLQSTGAHIDLSATNGVEMWVGETRVASYGSTAIIGEESGFHIEITPTELRFCYGPNTAGAGQPPSNRLAYVNGNELRVENSLSFGNFQFYQRDNGHFTLKFFERS